MNCDRKHLFNVMVAFWCAVTVEGPGYRGAADDASELFVRYCAPCHGEDGRAKTPAARKLGVKDLTQSRLTDSQIAQQIRDGKQATQNAPKMPAFSDKLTTNQVQSLISVVKGFRK